MRHQLQTQVDNNSIVKINAFRVSQCADTANYQVNAAVQCKGSNSFETLGRICADTAEVEKVFTGLFQIHVWNAPEDINVLEHWREELEEWLLEPGRNLELADETVRPFMLEIIYMKPVQD